MPSAAPAGAPARPLPSSVPVVAGDIGGDVTCRDAHTLPIRMNAHPPHMMHAHATYLPVRSGNAGGTQAAPGAAGAATGVAHVPIHREEVTRSALLTSWCLCWPTYGAAWANMLRESGMDMGTCMVHMMHAATKTSACKHAVACQVSLRPVRGTYMVG